jgi:hypothetical protein
MNASLMYRIASALLVLFAAGHTLGFRQTDPQAFCFMLAARLSVSAPGR